MQRHADHRALYVRARRKNHVMRSALFFRRARRLGHDVRVPTWLGHDVRARPSEWQNLEAGVDLLGIGSLCGRPTCALRSLDLIQCRGLLAALSAGQSRVFLVRPQVRHELVAVCDNPCCRQLRRDLDQCRETLDSLSAHDFRVMHVHLLAVYNEAVGDAIVARVFGRGF